MTYASGSAQASRRERRQAVLRQYQVLAGIKGEPSPRAMRQGNCRARYPAAVAYYPGPASLPVTRPLPAMLRGKSARSRAVLITLPQIFTDTQEMAGYNYR